MNHEKRETISLKTPLHITLSVLPGLTNLRTPELLMAFRNAVEHAKRFEFNVLHYSLLGDHVHILAEAADAIALDRGMRSLGTRFAKAIRRVSGGRGRVFASRYHLHVLRSPTEAKRALKYILLNFSKHSGLIEHVDDYSSGYAFQDWSLIVRMNDLLEEQLSGTIPAGIHAELSAARSWLAREGWKRAA